MRWLVFLFFFLAPLSYGGMLSNAEGWKAAKELARTIEQTADELNVVIKTKDASYYASNFRDPLKRAIARWPSGSGSDLTMMAWAGCQSAAKFLLQYGNSVVAFSRPDQWLYNRYVSESARCKNELKSPGMTDKEKKELW